MADYYELLDVRRDASAEEIKKAYRVKARQYLSQGPHRFQPQFTTFAPHFFHPYCTCTCHKGYTGHSTFIVNASLGDTAQGVDNAMKEIDGTQITIVIQKDLGQSLRIRTDLFKQNDNQILVFQR
jgi:hypothetical protein